MSEAMAEPTSRPRWAEFQGLLDQIVDGKLPPPNFEERDLSEIANNVASGGLIYLKGLLRRPGGSKPWACYWLRQTQGGAFDGRGYVIWYANDGGRGGQFALCRHENIEGAGANPTRGWHPSRCALCGLDTSVGSGD